MNVEYSITHFGLLSFFLTSRFVYRGQSSGRTPASVEKIQKFACKFPRNYFKHVADTGFCVFVNVLPRFYCTINKGEKHNIFLHEIYFSKD